MGALGATAPAIPDASAAIASGQKTFNDAYAQASGSLAGTAAVAAGIVAQLPKGQITTALNQAVGVVGDAEAGAAIGSVIPGYGTAIGATLGAIVGIVSQITSSTPPSPQGEFRSTPERYCFPALPLVPTVGETPSALAQALLEPVVWPTYRAQAVSWLPVAIDSDLGSPAPTQTPPLTVTFGVGWVSPPSSTATSTQQGYYGACAWMASNGVSRANALKHDDAAGDFASFAAATKNAAITAMGGEDLFNEATDLFRSWYGTGGWHTTPDPTLAGLFWPPDNGAWTTPTKGYPAVQGFQGVWLSVHHVLRAPTGALDFTYYTGNYILQNLGPYTGMQWTIATVDETWFGWQAGIRNNNVGASFNLAPLPDTTAIALFELASLAVTGVIPREGADVAALHFLLGLAWMWRRGYETEKARTLEIRESFGVANGVLLDTHDNFSRCIGLVQAKIRAAKKKAAAAPKPKAPPVPAAVAQKAAASNASLAKGVQVTQANAAIASGIAPLALAAAPVDHTDRDAAIAVAVAAGLAGAILWRRRRPHG
jgi:hypothetical protein